MAWDESKHPRVPQGKNDGGKFTNKEGASAAGAAAREAAGMPASSELLEKLKGAGFSVNLAGQVPKTGFMTARTLTTEWKAPISKVTDRDITDFILKNTGLLSEDDAYVGGWLDNGFGYLDVSYNYQSMHDALVVARKGSQLSVYDVVNDSYIDVKEYWNEQKE